MIGRNQLVLAVIRLSPTNRSLPLLGALRQLVGPIHPIDTGIDVMLVARADFEDPSYPIIIRLLPRLSRLAGFFLALDGRIVGDEDKAFAVVLDTVH